MITFFIEYWKYRIFPNFFGGRPQKRKNQKKDKIKREREREREREKRTDREHTGGGGSRRHKEREREEKTERESMEFNPSGYRGDPGIPHSDTSTFGYLLACSNVSSNHVLPLAIPLPPPFFLI